MSIVKNTRFPYDNTIRVILVGNSEPRTIREERGYIIRVNGITNDIYRMILRNRTQ